MIKRLWRKLFPVPVTNNYINHAPPYVLTQYQDYLIMIDNTKRQMKKIYIDRLDGQVTIQVIAYL